MEKKNFELYVGVPLVEKSETERLVVELIKQRHPGCTFGPVVDGYWSGVQEETLHVTFTATSKASIETSQMVQAISKNLFVALDEI